MQISYDVPLFSSVFLYFVSKFPPGVFVCIVLCKFQVAYIYVYCVFVVTFVACYKQDRLEVLGQFLVFPISGRCFQFPKSSQMTLLIMLGYSDCYRRPSFKLCLCSQSHMARDLPVLPLWLLPHSHTLCHLLGISVQPSFHE
jgi:hypothetical protein